MSEAEERRRHRIERLTNRLNERSNPRELMLLIVGATGLVGFLTSYLLRHLGLRHHMGVRYLLAVSVAYLAFLGLLGIWLAIIRPRRHGTPTVSSNAVGDTLWIGDPYYAGSGPGSSVVSDADADDVIPAVDATGGGGGSGGVGGGIGKIDGEGALLVVILLIVVAVLAALFASVWVIIEAPVLLAELLVDGALLAGMAHRLRPKAGQHWMLTAVERTYKPFLITTVAFAGVGFGLQYFVPQATTMIEAVQMATW